MASWIPGVEDPLVGDPRGRPNWNLQTKSRTRGPPDQLGNSLMVLPPQQSPYGTAPERDANQRGMGHFDHHLRQTETEQVWRGYGIPDHLRSGNDVPEKRTGRAPPLRIERRPDPKDGGVWEPVKREYPKVARIESGYGVKIVDRKPRMGKPVDIWPDTITVRDAFKPGGLKMFEGKRATNTMAFPGAMGYKPPETTVDYSSVAHGGPFGAKLVHANEKMAVNREQTFRVDRRAQYQDPLPPPAGSGAATPALGEVARVPPIPLPASVGGGRGLYGGEGTPVSRLGSMRGASPALSAGSNRLTSSAGRMVATEVLKPYMIPVKGGHGEGQQLKPASNWTFLGNYRP